ncbi:MAG: hypothetical protein KatS3mg065_1006 [Chloroflexota bacterium]|nr:MAG: hypothetical protein KatS3mg065_1006 [Chloroflexota bacterium]
MFVSLRSGQPAGNDPWEANTLEWATTSPPPPYNFEHLPPIRSERPLFDLRHGLTKDDGAPTPAGQLPPATAPAGH